MNEMTAEEKRQLAELLEEIDDIGNKLNVLMNRYEGVRSSVKEDIVSLIPETQRAVLESMVCRVKSARELEDAIGREIADGEINHENGRKNAIEELNNLKYFGDMKKTKARIRTCARFQLLTPKEDKG